MFPSLARWSVRLFVAAWIAFNVLFSPWSGRIYAAWWEDCSTTSTCPTTDQTQTCILLAANQGMKFGVCIPDSYPWYCNPTRYNCCEGRIQGVTVCYTVSPKCDCVAPPAGG